MPDTVTFTFEGQPITAARGSTVAGALLSAGVTSFRKSVTGEPRVPLCGMGTCFECRVEIDGRKQCRSCQIECQDGMEVSGG